MAARSASPTPAKEDDHGEPDAGDRRAIMEESLPSVRRIPHEVAPTLVLSPGIALTLSRGAVGRNAAELREPLA